MEPGMTGLGSTGGYRIQSPAQGGKCEVAYYSLQDWVKVHEATEAEHEALAEVPELHLGGNPTAPLNWIAL